MSRSRRQGYIPTPFEGTDAPPGPDPDALAELRREARASGPDDVGERTHGPVAREKPEPAAPRRPPVPRESAAPASTSTRGDEAGRPAASRASEQPSATVSAARGGKATSTPGRKGRPSKGARSQRAVRLNPRQEAMLLQLADIRGIDLNAAISVAIAEDWRRWFGDRKDVS